MQQTLANGSIYIFIYSSKYKQTIFSDWSIKDFLPLILVVMVEILGYDRVV